MSWIPTLTLFVMMLALGMTLRLDDFRRLATMPVAMAVGLVGQFVLLPAVAFALAHAFALSRTQAIGLVLIAACPGGVIANVFSRFARGNVALAISLTAAGSVLGFATLPLVLGFAMRSFGADGPQLSLSFVEMAAPLFGTTALPVLLGMAVLEFKPRLGERLHQPLINLSTGVLMLLIVGLGIGVARSSGELSLGTLFRDVAPAVVALVGITMGIGMLSARALGLDPGTARTLTLEIGLQNFNMALVVAMSMLREQRYAGPALLYLPVMFLFAGIVIAMGRRDASAERKLS
jgi:BASS family bile acid:Na+ symporter